MATNTRLAVREGRGDAVDALNEGDGRYSTYVRPVFVIALSQEPIDGFLPNFGHVCILQSQWTD